MSVSDKDREATWELDQAALEQVLHDLDRVRTAFIQDYIDRRIENRHGDVTAQQIDKFRHNGGVVWDANHLSLAQMLKFRSSLVSHGWGLTAERDELLRQAKEALLAVGKALLVVKGTLNQPYPDAPEWTPWTRFVEEPARRAYNLGSQIRAFVTRVTQ